MLTLLLPVQIPEGKLAKEATVEDLGALLRTLIPEFARRTPGINGDGLISYLFGDPKSRAWDLVEAGALAHLSRTTGVKIKPGGYDFWPLENTIGGAIAKRVDQSFLQDLVKERIDVAFFNTPLTVDGPYSDDVAIILNDAEQVLTAAKRLKAEGPLDLIEIRRQAYSAALDRIEAICQGADRGE